MGPCSDGPLDWALHFTLSWYTGVLQGMDTVAHILESMLVSQSIVDSSDKRHFGGVRSDCLKLKNAMIFEKYQLLSRSQLRILVSNIRQARHPLAALAAAGRVCYSCTVPLSVEGQWSPREPIAEKIR